MEAWKCDVCAKSFSGLVCFQQHEASEKHRKKVQLMKGVTYEAPKPVNPESVNQLYCSICMVSISGLDNYQKHANSLEHAIMIQKKSRDLLSQSVSSTFELKTEQNQLMNSTVPLTSPISTVKPFAECKPCQKQFSGIEPYQQHLASANHMKKCGYSNQMMLNDKTSLNVGNEKFNFPIDSQSSVSSYNDSKIIPQPFVKCDTCQMEFSGMLPYQLHLVSETHKEKVGNQLSGSQNAFRCDICAMTFSGPVPFDQHLVSIGHQKKIKIAELSKQMVTTGSLPSPGQSNVNDRLWYCDACKKQCSGPVPYNSHLISQNHLKKARNMAVEEHLMKIRESRMLSCVGNDKTDSNLSNEVTSTADLYSEFTKQIYESSVMINDLNISVKNNDQKFLPDKFQTNTNDLINLPGLNIIEPEKLDITVFGPEDEIMFNNPTKGKEGFSIKKV